MALVLIRHGQSLWNAKKRFTGWVDVPLSAKGHQEAMNAGAALKDMRFDCVYTSELMRAKQTALLCLLGQKDPRIPVFIKPEGERRAMIHAKEAQEDALFIHTHWQLNERCYGALQGLDKHEVMVKQGEEQVQKWRRGLHDTPPEGESLADTIERVRLIWEPIQAQAKDKHILIAAHGNSLRGLIALMKNLDERAIEALEIQTGQPMMYVSEGGQWKRRDGWNIFP